jgi:hypothetical protein
LIYKDFFSVRKAEIRDSIPGLRPLVLFAVVV